MMQRTAAFEAPLSSLSTVGVGRRFAALLVDALVSLVWTIPLSTITTTSNPRSVTFKIGGGQAWLVLAIWFVYFLLMEAAFGATLGKLALGIRVVREDGGRITPVASLVRNAARVVDGIPWVIPYLLGAILVWNSPRNQRLGDRWAHTIVKARGPVPWTRSVTDPRPAGIEPPPPLPPPPPAETPVPD